MSGGGEGGGQNVPYWHWRMYCTNYQLIWCHSIVCRHNVQQDEPEPGATLHPPAVQLRLRPPPDGRQPQDVRLRFRRPGAAGAQLYTHTGTAGGGSGLPTICLSSSALPPLFVSRKRVSSLSITPAKVVVACIVVLLFSKPNNSVSLSVSVDSRLLHYTLQGETLFTVVV